MNNERLYVLHPLFELDLRIIGKIKVRVTLDIPDDYTDLKNIVAKNLSDRYLSADTRKANLRDLAYCIIDDIQEYVLKNKLDVDIGLFNHEFIYNLPTEAIMQRDFGGYYQAD